MATVSETAESICTVCDNGTVEWHNTAAQLHRIDGPAIEGSNGVKEWFLNGKLHRLDGPAIVWADGGKTWSVNGRLVFESEFPAAVAAYCKSHPNCPSVAYYMSVTGRLTMPALSA